MEDLEEHQEFQVGNLGRRTRMGDGSGWTAWAYDARGRVTAASKHITGTGTYTTTYGYDALDRLVTVIYPGGEQVTTTYNPQDLPESLTGLDAYVSAASYNALGQTELVSLGNTVDVDYQYFSAQAGNNRLQRIRVPATSADLLDLTYAYDDVGNVASITDAADSGQVQTFEYDALDRLVQAGDVDEPYDISYSYDEIGNLLSRDGPSYAYDGSGHAHGQPHAVTGVGGAEYEYDQNGNMVGRSDGCGGVTQVFDVENRLSEVVGACSAPVDFSDYQVQSYGGSQDQNPTVTVEGVGAVLHIVGNGWKKIAFPYTVTLDTVLEFDFRSGAEGEIHGIGFDTDDLLSPDRTFQLYGTQSWGIGAYNDYVGSEWKHYSIPVGQFYTGAMLYLIFANDHDVPSPTAESLFANIVVYESTAAGETATFAYDGDGNRVLASRPGGSSTAYPGEHYEVEGSVTRSYYYLGSQRVAMRVSGDPNPDNNGVFYFHTDHLGSTSVLSNESGEQAFPPTRYYPYGEARTGDVNSLPTDHGFTGHKHASNIRLVDMKARWYDPQLGRFISPDTIVPAPANPQSLNRYSYVLNNPVRYTDPSGHFAWIPIGLVGGLIGGAIYGYGSQVMDNLNQGKNLGQALTTDIDPGKVALYAGAGAAIGTGIGVVAVGASVVVGAVTPSTAATLGTAGTGAVTGANAACGGDFCASELQLACGGDCSDEVVAAGRNGLHLFSQAAEYGIRSYNQLRTMTRGTGLRAHHIIEQRFARILSMDPGQMQGVALTQEEHQVFTRMWSSYIGHDNWRVAITTSTATIEDIWFAAQQIYANHPELLEAARQTIFGR